MVIIRKPKLIRVGRIWQGLQLRKPIVDWIAQLAHEFDFECLTVHMAVDYLDRVTSVQTFSSSMLPVVAASCLLIAAKFEEAAERVPSLSELLAAMGTPASFSRRHLAACELEVLWLLGWNLRCATRLHFFRAFRALGLSVSQDTLDRRAPTNQEQEYMSELAKFFCDVAAQQPELAEYDYEVATAAAIASARNVTGIRPVWPKELSANFGFSEREIAPCCEVLLDKYRVTFPDRFSAGNIVKLHGMTESPGCSDSPTNVVDISSTLL